MTCNRQHGGSCRDCECRLSDGTWAQCPPAARGIISFARGQGFTGDICADCGGARMVRSGACEVCSDCGATSGCS